MARLLLDLRGRGVAADYVSHILAAFGTADGGPATTPEGRESVARGSSSLVHRPSSTLVHRPSPALVEPLSEREVEILRLIAEGLTNREIASRLFLSLNTIKVHNRNIYGKLDVHSRTQAVARARALGVLPAI